MDNRPLVGEMEGDGDRNIRTGDMVARDWEVKVAIRGWQGTRGLTTVMGWDINQEQVEQVEDDVHK
jgi:hypothetical protein